MSSLQEDDGFWDNFSHIVQVIYAEKYKCTWIYRDNIVDKCISLLFTGDFRAAEKEKWDF